MPDTRTFLLLNIEGCTFIHIAHSFSDVSSRELTIGLGEKRHVVVVLVHHIRQILIIRAIVFAHEAPYAAFASIRTRQIERSIGVGKTKRCIFACKIALLTSYFNHVLAPPPFLAINHIGHDMLAALHCFGFLNG